MNSVESPKVITAGGAGAPKKSNRIKKNKNKKKKASNADSPAKEMLLELEPREESQREEKEQFHDNDASNDNDGTLDKYPHETDHSPHHHHHKHHRHRNSVSAVVPAEGSKAHELLWLFLCFLGIMASFVCYGILLEYTTSGGRKLHELSFLFVTSALYTMTGAAGRYVRDETPTTIPPARFAILGLTSMGSTYCSVRSLRYVIFPIQVLAKSCKPVPVMIMGALMGKKYPLKKYINVVLIVVGVALFTGGGATTSKTEEVEPVDETTDEDQSRGRFLWESARKLVSESDDAPGQVFGIILLFISLCFDGGTGAYEDKLMSVHSVQPFDLMYNIQLGKTILAGVSLLVLNQVHKFVEMCHDMGFFLIALGLSGAMGQVFIFVTIAKFGALTCSIIGLARKVTTLVASIVIYGHSLNAIQFTGLGISVTAMVMNFWGKKGGGHGHSKDPPKTEESNKPEEMQSMLDAHNNDDDHHDDGDIELAQDASK